MNSKVSIIIPTYNRSSVVCDAIESVIEQTYPHIEVIVVDDGSTDDTGAVVQRRFPQVRYVYQKNQGVSAARNNGIDQAKHDWIAFLDSDDQWRPNKLELQLLETVRQQSLISYTNEIWYRKGRRVNPKKKHQKYSGDIFEKALPLCIISASSILIHRSVFDRVGIFDEALPACEDYDLWLRMACLYPILYLPDVFIIKRNGVDEHHLSQKFWGMDRFRIQSLEKILKENSLNIRQQRALREELQRKREIFNRGALKRAERSIFCL